MLVQFILGFFLLSWIGVLIWRRPKNFPPGPRGLPVLGYVPFLNKYDPTYPHKALQKLGELYGPVVGFYLGPTQPFISVSGYEAIREVLNNRDLDGRPTNAARQERSYNERLGIIHNEGEQWMEQRRFSLRHLRDLGFGKTSSESMIQDEIHDLLTELTDDNKESHHHVVDFTGLFNLSLINILWALIGGSRFARTDARLKYLLSLVEVFIRSGHFIFANVPIPGFLLPIMRATPFLKGYVGLKNNTFGPLQSFIEESIEEHIRDRLEDSPRDFIDVYLSEMEKQGLSGEISFHRKQLVSVIVDLFLAGAETTSNSIGFAMLYLLHHPQVQIKMQEEMNRVCGDSLPLLSQRTHLPYTEAVLMEVQRMGDIVPLAVAHKALRDTTIQGYTIPEGSIVAVNIHTVHYDEKHWGDPKMFRPERHLKPDGTLNKTDYLLPFSAGKRMCLGESLARNTYFLFTTAIIKQFRLKPISVNEPMPTLVPENGLTMGYRGFKAILEPCCPSSNLPENTPALL